MTLVSRLVIGTHHQVPFYKEQEKQKQQDHHLFELLILSQDVAPLDRRQMCSVMHCPAVLQQVNMRRAVETLVLHADGLQKRESGVGYRDAD